MQSISDANIYAWVSFCSKMYTGSIIYIHCCCISSFIPRDVKLGEYKHMPEVNTLRFSLQTRVPENDEQRELKKKEGKKSKYKII